MKNDYLIANRSGPSDLDTLVKVKINSSAAVLLFSLIACLRVPAADKVDSTTLEGKVLFGYQGWFDCPTADGKTGAWSHWSRGVPSAETTAIDMYPDLSEFDSADLCAVPGMTIGGKKLSCRDHILISNMTSTISGAPMGRLCTP